MVSQVSEQLASTMGRNIRPTYGYYRQSNGWITFSTITRLEKLKYVERGWQPLDLYGQFDATPYTLNHPFEALFMFGGAHELPVDQVIQTGLYMDPPLVPTCGSHLTQYHRSHSQPCWVGAKAVEFPQLEGVDLPGPFECSFCEKVLPTVAAREQHQSVAHKEDQGHIQTGHSLGTSLGEVLAQAGITAPSMRANEGPSQAELQQRVDELEDQLAAKTEAYEASLAAEPEAETPGKSSKKNETTQS